MRNILKASTLESKFPLLAVEDGCILSKDADVTVGFKVRLPEESATILCPVHPSCSRSFTESIDFI